MNKFSKLMILFSGLVIILFLILEAWRENLNMDWQRYQQKYKNELLHRAQNEQDRLTASEYEIKLRQIVIPRLDRADRCVTCHVAMEDSRMSEMPHPLKSHPGDYLDKHDVNIVGCTSCHDGQGRAITAEDAHGRGADKFWEKPLLPKPFAQANCARCHADNLEQAPMYNYGKLLFKQKGCFACHSIGDIGGVKGPALSDIGNASFHVKMPTHHNREKLLKRFDENVNLAYLHEAIVEPDAQPEDTIMKKMEMTEEEVTALVVYMKSLSSERRVMDIGVTKKESVAVPGTIPKAAMPKSSKKIIGGSSKGFMVFSRNCVACHTIGGGEGVGPDLKGVVEKRESGWLRRFIQYPSQMIEEKDPIAMELLEKYGTPMVDMGLSDEEVSDVIEYLKNPDDVSVSSDGEEVVGEESLAEIAKKQMDKAEIHKGLALFQGKQRFINGGVSCLACHSLRNDSVIGGGRLAKELTTSYERLGEVGMTNLLANAPFPLMREAYKEKPLTSDEVSALTTFLRHVNEEQGNQQAKDYGPTMIFMGLGGLVFLLGLYCVFWMNRKRKSVNKKIFDRQTKSENEM